MRWKNAWLSTSSWRRNPETQRGVLAEVEGIAREIECVLAQIEISPLNPVLARTGMDCYALLVVTMPAAQHNVRPNNAFETHARDSERMTLNHFPFPNCVALIFSMQTSVVVY